MSTGDGDISKYTILVEKAAIAARSKVLAGNRSLSIDSAWEGAESAWHLDHCPGIAVFAKALAAALFIKIPDNRSLRVDVFWSSPRMGKRDIKAGDCALVIRVRAGEKAVKPA